MASTIRVPVSSILRRPWRFGTAVALVAFALVAIQVESNSPEAIQTQVALEAEARAIPAVAGAQFREMHSSHKRERALVSIYYSTDASYAEIRAHYDAELGRRGWQFVREQS